jgi:hypothetical protein
MPSDSWRFFDQTLLRDVNRLIEAHENSNPEGKGKRALGHFTRSAVLLLSSAWEVYVEGLVVEAVTKILTSHNPESLPDALIVKFCEAVKADKHERKHFKIVGDGWRGYYINACKAACDKFNTAKSTQVGDLMEAWVCADRAKLFDSWRRKPCELDEFMTRRGDIAHRGSASNYVQETDLRSYVKMITDFAADTDNYMQGHVRGLLFNPRKVWRKLVSSPIAKL